MKEKILFIINPKSGSQNRKKKSLPSIINNHIDKSHFEYQIVHTTHKGHIAEILENRIQVDKLDIVIIAGGDGSINEALPLLANTNIPLGIIPLGSGNGLARHLGYNLKMASFVGKLNQYETGKIDLVKANGQLYASICGVGFDALVAGKFGNHKMRGLAGYSLNILKGAFSYPFFRFSVSDAGHTETGEAFILDFCNSNQYGYNIKLAPLANLQDGKMDLYIIRKFPRWKFFFLIYYVLINRHHKSKYFKHIQSGNFRLKLNQPVHLHLDGEAIGKTESLELEVLPLALTLLKV